MAKKTEAEAIADYLAKIKPNNVPDRPHKFGVLQYRMFKMEGQ